MPLLFYYLLLSRCRCCFAAAATITLIIFASCRAIRHALRTAMATMMMFCLPLFATAYQPLRQRRYYFSYMIFHYFADDAFDSHADIFRRYADAYADFRALALRRYAAIR